MPSDATAERPATFRETLDSREFRAVFWASAASWFGDSAARAAVAALVYQRTNSVGTSAATFAISYLPWLGVGSVLTAIAERHSYRKVMILCDVLRMVFMALVAVPGVPVPALIGLLFVTALLNPPFDAARSALLPYLLAGDRYVVGLTMQRTSAQVAQIVGYGAGATFSGFDARFAVLFNALTFGYSAVAVAYGVRERPPALTEEHRSNVMRETAEGFGLVFGTPLLRAIAIITFCVAFFSILPEGLAAGWAAHLTDDSNQRGWYQAVIMVANPAGFIIGGLVIGRFTAPSRRIRLIRPFAVLSPLVLLPAFFDPGIGEVVVISAACGFLAAGLLPPCNALFVQVLPNEFRARAFGVMQAGLQIVQGAAVFLGGALSDAFPLPTVVGADAAFGTCVLLVIAVRFPSVGEIEKTITAARLAKAPGPLTPSAPEPAEPDAAGVRPDVDGFDGARGAKSDGASGAGRRARDAEVLVSAEETRREETSATVTDGQRSTS